jgi:ribosomal protein L30/L7E
MSLNEVEDALEMVWSKEKAFRTVQGLKATEAMVQRLKEDNRQLEGMLNMLNNCGDVTQQLERTF